MTHVSWVNISAFSICSSLDAITEDLEIRMTTTPFEIDQLRTALKQWHHLKAGRPAGNTIWQGIYKTSPKNQFIQLCTVICWSKAALRLKNRDNWIERDSLVRPSRFPLVMQLGRFLILKPHCEKNGSSSGTHDVI